MNKIKNGSVITVETDGGILHNMTVKSVNKDGTITGEVATYPEGKSPQSETVTIPKSMIR